MLTRRLWSACLRHERSYSKAVAVPEAETKTYTLRRVDTALNWALTSKAIPPQGDVFRNLKEEELEKHGASPQESESGSKVFARGSYSPGASDITKPLFNKIYKEVTQYLSSSYKLFVHDGAIGSFLNSNIKLRSISEDPSVALLLSKTLCPTSTREVSNDAYPLSVYIAAGLRPQALESFLGTSSSYIAVDFDRSALVAGGKAYADLSVLKSALAAFASPALLANGALPLKARMVSVGDSVVMVAAPEKISGPLREWSIFNDAGLIWNDDGVSRFFNSKKLNHLAHPAAFVVVTNDSSGAIPEICKLNAGQAAFHYLAGYDGETFSPGCNSGLASVSPASIAKELSGMLTGYNVSAYLVNSNGLADKHLLKLLGDAASGQLPKTKKPSEDSVKALKAKYLDFVSKNFPDLPETITCD